MTNIEELPSKIPNVILNLSPALFASFVNANTSPTITTFFIGRSIEEIKTGFISNGYEVYSCLSPFDVSSIRHIIIPELSLAFVTSDELSQYKGNIFRNIHISSCVDKKALRGVRQKVRLYEKLADQMLKDAVSSFANARLAHTELENVYRPYLDIDALNKLAEAEKM